MNMSNARQDFYGAILDTAVAGGINYWASVYAYRQGISAALITHEESTVGENEFHPRQTHETVSAMDFDGMGYEAHHIPVDLGTVRRGWNIFAKDPNITNRYALQALSDARNGDLESAACNIDAGLADVIVQMGIYGKIKFA